MKQNKHLLEPIVRYYFKTGKLDISLLYKEYYNEMYNLFDEYNTARFGKKQLMINIVKRFRDLTSKEFYCSNA